MSVYNLEHPEITEAEKYGSRCPGKETEVEYYGQDDFESSQSNAG